MGGRVLRSRSSGYFVSGDFLTLTRREGDQTETIFAARTSEVRAFYQLG